MPIYEYRCMTCGCNFEIKQGFDTEPFSVCPRCQKEARRIFRPAPIIFKGSGFYVTDHGGGSSTMSTKSEEGGETKEPTRAAASNDE